MSLDTPARPPLRSRIVLAGLERLPQGLLSRAFGRAADVPLPPGARRPVLGAFARLTGIDVAEAELPLREYRTLNEFFVRRLRPGARAWPADADVAASPVDGTVGQAGRIEDGALIQAKGLRYTAAHLLDDSGEAERYRNGTFLTLYLSPRDYHRIHAPHAGVVKKARHVPGSLLPVNRAAAAHVPRLFCRNERLVCYLDGDAGRVAVVAVGAYNVGRVSARFDDAWNAEAGASGWVTNRPAGRAETREYPAPPAFERGEEIMAFHLGSTVVLLWESSRVRLCGSLRPGGSIRLGEPITDGGVQPRSRPPPSGPPP